MSSGFWNDRFRSEAYLYGTAPKRFVWQEAARLPDGGDVLELGAGVRLVWQKPEDTSSR